MAVRRFLIAVFLLLPLIPAGLSGEVAKKKAHAGAKQTARRSARNAKKLRHLKRAFVASADLKPMAQQLLENRTPQGYAGVEQYARRHRKDEAAPMAWFVLGYAHFLDKDYAKAIECWQHAKPLEPVLGDYLVWLQASAYQGEGNNPEVEKVLEGYEQKYPDSLNLHDALLLHAGALVANGKSDQAIAELEKHRAPVNPETEFALATAYKTAGMQQKATEILRRIYFEMPISEQAGLAALTLQSQGEKQPAGSFDQRRTRAALLMKARRFQDAASDLSSLIEQTPPEKMPAMQVEFATALYRAHKRDDAQRLFETVLQNPAATTEVKAQTLYFLAECARDKDDQDKHAAYVSQLRTLAPDSSWMGQALLSAGNMYMLKGDFATGVKFYAEIFERKQNDRFSPYAHWKTAWLNYQMGKKDEAKRLFDEQLALYPASSEVPAALYWRGRIAEDEGDKAIARAYYQKLSENYRYFYYANLGRDRLARIGLADAGDPAVLDRLPSPAAPPRAWDPPDGNVRLQKAQLLANAALFDFAAKELQAAAAGSPPWLARSLAALYGDQGSYIHAIESLKRAVPGYFSVEINQIPRPVWEGLFPRPFWDELRKDALQNKLDPYLVASLIRQESEFNPLAVSPANAMGLMQLLPSVGRGLAKQMKIRHFSSDDLLIANTNLQMGTRYFKHMVDHYDGQVEYALAAYNAGEDRVDDWRQKGNFKSVDEFVESIPFTETREYVQAILRNAMLYKLLYPKG